MKVRRRKKDVSVSFAYRLAFFMPRPMLEVTECGFGDASIGITAGSGIEGAGETDRREEEKDDRRLWLTTLGGFIGSATEVGVPGADGAGEPTDAFGSVTESCERCPKSGGAGLLEDIRRGGRSAFACVANFDGLSSCVRVYWPSFVFRE